MGKIGNDLKCPHCQRTWPAPVEPGGGYHRRNLQSTAAEMAAHIRSAHGNEATALKLERWAVSPDPGATGRRPT